MSKTQTIRARVKPELKRDAETVLRKLGLTSSEAITLFLNSGEAQQGPAVPRAYSKPGDAARHYRRARTPQRRDLRECLILEEENARDLSARHAADHYWECHIEPDWRLIYAVTATEVVLFRTGTHADLFD